MVEIWGRSYVLLGGSEYGAERTMVALAAVAYCSIRSMPSWQVVLCYGIVCRKPRSFRSVVAGGSGGVICNHKALPLTGLPLKFCCPVVGRSDLEGY